jgi:tetratricopeptide (TPR) repeat protein
MSKNRQGKKAPGKTGWLHRLFLNGATPGRIPYWVFIAPLLACAAAISFFQSCSHDLWWHLETGEWISRQHTIPHADPFSHTAAGAPWIAHEWLFGLLAYSTFKLIGLTGLITLKAWIIAGLLALTAWAAHVRGAAGGMTLMVLAGAFVISRQRFDERPELISLGIAVSFLLIFEYSRIRGRWFILLPCLQMLWVNLHGGTALLGWGLAAAFLLDRARELHHPGSAWHETIIQKELRGHLAAFAGVIAFSFANPYTARALTYGVLRAQSPLRIEEFQSLAARMRLGPDIAVTTLIVFALLLVAFFLWRPRQVRVFEWLLLPALMILCISFFRFRSLFAILLAPSLARHLSQGKLLSRLRWWLPALASLMLLVQIAVSDVNSYGYRFGAGIHSGILPVEAAEFIKTSGLTGRMFNEYEFGGYLIWCLAPEFKVFIDGREDVYVQPGVAAAYANRFRSAGSWQDLTAKYGIDFAIVKYPVTPPASPGLSLEAIAFPRSDWALVYVDDLAVIYVRRNGKNVEMIRNKEIKAVQPLQLSSYLDEILKDPEKQQQFLTEMDAGLRIHPDSFRSHFLMGIFAIKRGSQYLAQAVQEFQRTIAINPEYVPAHLNLGAVYRRLGQTKDAKKAYRRALKLQENAAVRRELELLEAMR